MTFMNDELLEGGVKGEMVNSIHYREVRKYLFDSETKVLYFFVTKCYDEYVTMVLSKLRSPDVIIMNSCLWDVHRYGDKGTADYEINMNKLLDCIENTHPNVVFIWATTPPVHIKSKGGFLQMPGVDLVKINEVKRCNNVARKLIYDRGMKLVDFDHVFNYFVRHRAGDGVHWNEKAHRRMSNHLLEVIARAWGRPVPRLMGEETQYDNELFFHDEMMPRPRRLPPPDARRPFFGGFGEGGHWLIGPQVRNGNRSFDDFDRSYNEDYSFFEDDDFIPRHRDEFRRPPEPLFKSRSEPRPDRGAGYRFSDIDPFRTPQGRKRKREDEERSPFYTSFDSVPSGKRARVDQAKTSGKAPKETNLKTNGNDKSVADLKAVDGTLAKDGNSKSDMKKEDSGTQTDKSQKDDQVSNDKVTKSSDSVCSDNAEKVKNFGANSQQVLGASNAVLETESSTPISEIENLDQLAQSYIDTPFDIYDSIYESEAGAVKMPTSPVGKRPEKRSLESVEDSENSPVLTKRPKISPSSIVSLPLATVEKSTAEASDVSSESLSQNDPESVVNNDINIAPVTSSLATAKDYSGLTADSLQVSSVACITTSSVTSMSSSSSNPLANTKPKMSSQSSAVSSLILKTILAPNLKLGSSSSAQGSSAQTSRETLSSLKGNDDVKAELRDNTVKSPACSKYFESKTDQNLNTNSVKGEFLPSSQKVTSSEQNNTQLKEVVTSATDKVANAPITIGTSSSALPKTMSPPAKVLHNDVKTTTSKTVSAQTAVTKSVLTSVSSTENSMSASAPAAKVIFTAVAPAKTMIKDVLPRQAGPVASTAGKNVIFTARPPVTSYAKKPIPPSPNLLKSTAKTNAVSTTPLATSAPKVVLSPSGVPFGSSTKRVAPVSSEARTASLPTASFTSSAPLLTPFGSVPKTDVAAKGATAVTSVTKKVTLSSTVPFGAVTKKVITTVEATSSTSASKNVTSPSVVTKNNVTTARATPGTSATKSVVSSAVFSFGSVTKNVVTNTGATQLTSARKNVTVSSVVQSGATTKKLVTNAAGTSAAKTAISTSAIPFGSVTKKTAATTGASPSTSVVKNITSSSAASLGAVTKKTVTTTGVKSPAKPFIAPVTMPFGSVTKKPVVTAASLAAISTAKNTMSPSAFTFGAVTKKNVNNNGTSPITSASVIKENTGSSLVVSTVKGTVSTAVSVTSAAKNVVSPTMTSKTDKKEEPLKGKVLQATQSPKVRNVKEEDQKHKHDHKSKEEVHSSHKKPSHKKSHSSKKKDSSKSSSSSKHKSEKEVTKKADNGKTVDQAKGIHEKDSKKVKDHRQGDSESKSIKAEKAVTETAEKVDSKDSNEMTEPQAIQSIGGLKPQQSKDRQYIPRNRGRHVRSATYTPGMHSETGAFFLGNPVAGPTQVYPGYAATSPRDLYAMNYPAVQPSMVGYSAPTYEQYPQQQTAYVNNVTQYEYVLGGITPSPLSYVEQQSYYNTQYVRPEEQSVLIDSRTGQELYVAEQQTLHPDYVEMETSSTPEVDWSSSHSQNDYQYLGWL